MKNRLSAAGYQASIRAVDEAMSGVQASYTGGVTDPSTFPIASPWSSSTLERMVFEDIFGSDVPTNTRAAAMRIPAIARARNLLVSSIAGLPLKAKRLDEVLPTQPTWLTAAAGGTSPQLRLAWTLDDLIFYGWSCWWRTNGADKFPIAAGRVNMGNWSVNADNRVEINGQVVDDDKVILIPGLHEGILTYGKEPLDDTRTLYRNVRQRLANPVPQIDLHQTSGRTMTDEEIDAMIVRWAAARAGANGGVGYTNEHIQANELGASADAQLMIEARNAAAVEMARLIGVSAGLVDATTPKASLNYETQAGRNLEFTDRDLEQYMQPIEWRLSLDDVTPHGQHIQFDTTQLTTPTPSPTGPALED